MNRFVLEQRLAQWGGSYPPRSDFTYCRRFCRIRCFRKSLPGFGPKQRSVQRCRRRGIKRQSL